MFNVTDLNPYIHEDPYASYENTEYSWFNDIRAKTLNNLGLLLFISTLYYPCIVLGQHYMKNREPFVLKKSLFIWNLFLSAISFYIAYNANFFMYDYILKNGVTSALICDSKIYAITSLGWYMEIMSYTKLLEWIDTVFLVLRKKKVIFLHWFHHLVTYLYAIQGILYSYRADCSGVWFFIMNVNIHVIMYLYYALMAVKIRIPYISILTFFQTLQMFIGFVIGFGSLLCPNAHLNIHGTLFQLAMYGIYFKLFYDVLIKKKIKNK